MLFFALAVGFFFVARWAGWLALAYVSLFIALPRLYLGLHGLSDIVAGVFIGMAVSALTIRVLGQAAWTSAVAQWSQRSPAVFYPLMFLVTCQIADLFEASRLLAKGLHALLAHAVAWGLASPAVWRSGSSRSGENQAIISPSIPQ